MCGLIYAIGGANYSKDESILIDLDNTLASPYVFDPSEEVIAFINKLKEISCHISFFFYK